MNLPALIEDMPMREYLADPAPDPSVTAGTVKRLAETAPGKVWLRNARLNPEYEEEQATRFDIGTAAHSLFVGAGEETIVLSFRDYKTNAAKDARDRAYAAGATPVLERDMDRVEAMAEVAREQFGLNPEFGDLIPAMKREATILWREVGVTCRARPDFYIEQAATAFAPIIVHYKTTAIALSKRALERLAVTSGWDHTDEHYGAGVMALTGHEPEQYFAVQEITPPYLCMTARLDAAFSIGARAARKAALRTWARCLRAEEWPGHPVETVRLECPPWHDLAAGLPADEPGNEDNLPF